MDSKEEKEEAKITVKELLSPFVMKIVAPGDIVLDLSKLGDSTVRLGSNFRQDNDYISVTKAGKLHFTKPNKYWIEGSQKEYIPNIEDPVIGIVVDRFSESFVVDIGSPGYGSLSYLSFEGATRRNVPNLQAGALVFARVIKSHRDMAPELACVDATGKGAQYGPLKNGYMFECSIGLARALLRKPAMPILTALGKSLAYEISIGLNGRVWVNASSASTIILVSNAILNAEFLSSAQQEIMVNKLLQRVQHMEVVS